MILSHFSAAPIQWNWEAHKSKNYLETLKPIGLWVSVDDAEMNWLDWCRGEQFGLDRFAYRTEVKLKLDHNVLIIRSALELDMFVNLYGTNKPHPSLSDLSWTGMAKNYLRWDLVMQKYNGIIITPYLWERRLEGPMWYYAWDCASGCIWNNVVEFGPSEPFTMPGSATILEFERESGT